MRYLPCHTRAKSHLATPWRARTARKDILILGPVPRPGPRKAPMLLCKIMLNFVVHLVGVLLTPCPFWLRGRTLRRFVNCWNSVAVAVLSSRTSPSRNKDPVRASFRAGDCLQVPHRTSCISSTALSHVRLKLLSTDSRQGLTTKRTESRGRCSLLGRIKGPLRAFAFGFC